jgi:NitT/TauT family transport system substrate-binding protein
MAYAAMMLAKRAGVALASLAIGASIAQAADKVSVAMDWIINGTHAGFFIAQAKGYYSDTGLDVTISRGFGSGDTVKRAATGAAMLGVADTSSVIEARAREDVPVRVVAMMYNRAPLGIIYLKSSGIRRPKDLEGKKIARTAAGSSVVMFPAFLEANGIDRTKLEQTIGNANTMLPLLMSGKVDAVLGQTVNVARYQEAAKQQNAVVETMNYSDYGLDVYGNAIIAGTAVIADKPDVIARFVAASLKGTAYALEHPDEAVAMIKKAHPEADAVALKEELDAVTPIIDTSESQEKGIGYIAKERMQRTVDVVTMTLGLKKGLKVSDVYDPKFQPQAPIVVKK